MSCDVLLHDAVRRQWLSFTSPRDQRVARHPREIPALLREIETRVAKDKVYAAGFLTYEAAAAFDPACAVWPASTLPLAWFGLYDRPAVVPPPSPPETVALLQWMPGWPEEKFQQAVAHIRAAIAAGETYQVNLTFPFTADFSGTPREFFARLVHNQNADYAAYLDLGDQVLCSVSPELFFRKQGQTLVMRPMKGTVARGLTGTEDRQRAEQLRSSAKDRAENIMILDMVRNDLGRLADAGHVETRDICSLEKYPTVWQMTSTVAARTPAPLADIMAALFPCASITGAPKYRTMAIIKQLEQRPRGIYTGCIGYLTPSGEAQFSVAIRTAHIDLEQQSVSYGVGAGITWDSSPAAEYRECLQKAAVLTRPMPSFSLLETLLWRPGEGYWLLEEHLERLAASADYFDFSCDVGHVNSYLHNISEGFTAESQKVRLLLAADGRLSHDATPFDDTVAGPVRVGLAATPIDPGDPFLYHKTTERTCYQHARTTRPECDDVILWNPAGEITEATVANIVLELDGELVTPPVDSGLLAGTFRRRLLASGTIRERRLEKTDLGRCTRIFLINALRGWREALLEAVD